MITVPPIPPKVTLDSDAFAKIEEDRNINIRLSPKHRRAIERRLNDYIADRATWTTRFTKEDRQALSRSLTYIDRFISELTSNDLARMVVDDAIGNVAAELNRLEIIRDN